ncbi:MAG: hypothetical protein MUF64_26550 [Polyangiaceae bacterium]|nr:hypothetical protein [Polyangiaceae bacterium]
MGRTAGAEGWGTAVFSAGRGWLAGSLGSASAGSALMAITGVEAVGTARDAAEALGVGRGGGEARLAAPMGEE